MIEEETGAPLDIQSRAAGIPEGAAVAAGQSRLVARDDKKNPLISTFDWTPDATQRIFRVPAGFMRSQTQERIEALARERAAAAIDLALVEEGIEMGKQMMAEMIAKYSASSATASSAGASPAAKPAEPSGAARTVIPAGNGSGYLNEVSPLTERSASGEHTGAKA